jgi:hypothetical protein
MVLMERWLNTRAALVAAWSVVGLIAAAALAFVVYLAVPSLRDSGADAKGAARSATTTATVAATRTPTGPRQFTGAIERVEGQALVVRDNDGLPVRVVVQRGSRIGRLAFSSVADIHEGDTAVIRVSSNAAGALTAQRISLQPTDMPIISGPPRFETGNSSQTVAGTILSRDGDQLRINAGAVQVSVTLPSSVRVFRFSPLTTDDLKQGQRVAVDGELIVDGSLIAHTIQITGQ